MASNFSKQTTSRQQRERPTNVALCLWSDRRKATAVPAEILMRLSLRFRWRADVEQDVAGALRLIEWCALVVSLVGADAVEQVAIVRSFVTQR